MNAYNKGNNNNNKKESQHPEMLTAEGLYDSAPPRTEVAAQKAKTVCEKYVKTREVIETVKNLRARALGKSDGVH